MEKLTNTVTDKLFDLPTKDDLIKKINELVQENNKKDRVIKELQGQIYSTLSLLHINGLISDREMDDVLKPRTSWGR